MHESGPSNSNHLTTETGESTTSDIGRNPASPETLARLQILARTRFTAEKVRTPKEHSWQLALYNDPKIKVHVSDSEGKTEISFSKRPDEGHILDKTVLTYGIDESSEETPTITRRASAVDAKSWINRVTQATLAYLPLEHLSNTDPEPPAEIGSAAESLELRLLPDGIDSPVTESEAAILMEAIEYSPTEIYTIEQAFSGQVTSVGFPEGMGADITQAISTGPIALPPAPSS
jgi:hypothetical protein